MSIKIETEKVVIRGEQYRKVLSCKMLTETGLPFKYLKGECVFIRSNAEYAQSVTYQRDDGRTFDSQTYNYIHQGLTMPEEAFLERLEIIRKCGQRLQEINAELAIKNAGWNGFETFVL